MGSDQVILFVGLIITMAMVVIVVHELGHALAAKLCGWQCVGIGVMGLFIPWDKNVTVKTPFPRWSWTYFTGISVAFPKDPGRDKKWHYPVYLFSGLVASGAVIVTVAVVAWVLRNWMIAVLLIQPLVHLFFTLIPFGGSLATDGSKLKNLFAGGRPAELERLRFLVESSCIRGVIPSLSEEDFAVLTSSSQSQLNYFGYGYQLLAARELGDTTSAAEMESALTRLMAGHPHLIDALKLDVQSTELAQA